MINLDSIRNLTNPEPKDFDIYVDAYVEIMRYLIHNGYTDKINYTIYEYLDMFYNYYRFIIGMKVEASNSITDMTYKKEIVTMYYRSMLDIYNAKKISSAPYMPLCNNLALLIARELSDRIWFSDAWGINNINDFKALNFTAKAGMLEKMKKQKAIKDLGISYDEFVELLKIIQDYAFYSDSISTDNVGNSAFCLVITKSIASIVYKDDRQGYLKDGIKYYMRDIRNYTK